MGRPISAARAERRGEKAGAMERVSRERKLPLSYAQQRLWFINQLEPGSPAYNISMALRVRGKLRVEALQRAVEAVVERHEVLRTHFTWVEGQATQVIAERWGGSLELLDVRGRQEGESEARDWVRQEMHRGYDLGRGPLLRLGLVRMAEEEWILLLGMHHIVNDGGAEKAEPRDRCDVVHDVAGGVAGVAVEVHGAGRHQHRDADCEPQPGGDRGADRVFREHAGAEDGGARGGEFCPASAACAG